MGVRPALSEPLPRQRLGVVRAVAAFCGEQIVYGLLWLFGRVVETASVPWPEGPTGGEHIGDRPYEQWASRTGATVERRAKRGGLLPDFDVLRAKGFDPAQVDARVRHFYEHTAAYELDVWARTFAPANLALWLLVTTISRKVDQLNFPLDLLETASGMDSEIILLRRPDGSIDSTGWYRCTRSTGRSVYTGFYSSTRSPHDERVLVKVVFPMPNGNATVLLAPRAAGDGSLELLSDGGRFGDAGFYRLQRVGERHLRVWRIRSLREHFRVHVDEHGTLRCDHRLRFLGLPVLHLHYRMRPSAPGG